MTELSTRKLSRRTVLAAGAAAAGALTIPTVLRAQDRSIKVGVYGGYFKDIFDKNIFPDFTKATGIAVESVAEPTGEAWLVQLEQAAKAGQAPADLSMMSQTSTLKGEAVELFTPLDPKKIKYYDRPARTLRRQVSRRPGRRHRGRGLVHHVGHQHRCLPGGRRPPGRRCGIRPTRTSSACWLWPPTRFCSRSPPRPSCGGTNALDSEDGHAQGALPSSPRSSRMCGCGIVTRPSSSRR